MILVGELSLWVALLMATWTATVSFAGGATRRPELVAIAKKRSVQSGSSCWNGSQAGFNSPAPDALPVRPRTGRTSCPRGV